MNTTIAVAGSLGRVSIVAVEATERAGTRGSIKTVRYAQRLKQNIKPTEVLATIDRLFDALVADPDNLDHAQPRIVVSTSVAGGAIFEALYEDKRAGRRARPLGISTYSGQGADNRMAYVSPNRLASTLFSEWREGRIEVSPGLDTLRAQLEAFAPVQTKQGNVTFGREDMGDYDDVAVAVMHAVVGAGFKKYGVLRYADSRTGRIWPSKQMAVMRLAGAEGLVS